MDLLWPLALQPVYRYFTGHLTASDTLGITLREASEQVGVTRQTLMKAIKTGRISAEKTPAGDWRIEPVELFRVWPAVKGVQQPLQGNLTAGDTLGAPAEDEEIIVLLKAQLDDLRADRDHWRKAAEAERAERLALSEKLLTDQRPISERLPNAPEAIPPDPPKGLWARLFGWS